MVPLNTSNLQLATYNGTWPYVDCLAFTSLVNKDGYVFNDGITSNSIPLSQFGNRINGAFIIFNPNYGDGGGGINAVSNRKKTIVHEIGHCVDLAHYQYPTLSVLRTGWDLEFTNYFRPQAIERTDLLNYYAVLYN
jgi:hypothetical protein